MKLHPENSPPKRASSAKQGVANIGSSLTGALFFFLFFLLVAALTKRKGKKEQSGEKLVSDLLQVLFLGLWSCHPHPLFLLIGSSVGKLPSAVYIANLTGRRLVIPF